MFSIQYYNGKDAEWKATGSGTFYDKAQAIQRMHGMADMCDHSVRFRVAEAVTL